MAGLIRVHKPKVWFLLVGAIVLLMGVKGGRPFLLPAGPPIELNNQPALLFFNNDEGCECVMPLYQKADAVIAAWPPERRAQVPLHRIVLDERPDLQRQYAIERAPILLLLDASGEIVWREWGVASNPNVFDLARVEAKISLLLSVTSAD
jgi:hypothetical protein